MEPAPGCAPLDVPSFQGIRFKVTMDWRALALVMALIVISMDRHITGKDRERNKSSI
jgi:hypothetical protein